MQRSIEREARMTSGGGAPIRFSYCMVPDYPMADQFRMIRVADECGFYACCATDERGGSRW
jgi:hypothetical protein